MTLNCREAKDIRKVLDSHLSKTITGKQVLRNYTIKNLHKNYNSPEGVYADCLISFSNCVHKLERESKEERIKSKEEKSLLVKLFSQEELIEYFELLYVLGRILPTLDDCFAEYKLRINQGKKTKGLKPINLYDVEFNNTDFDKRETLRKDFIMRIIGRCRNEPSDKSHPQIRFFSSMDYLRTAIKNFCEGREFRFNYSKDLLYPVLKELFNKKGIIKRFEYLHNPKQKVPKGIYYINIDAFHNLYDIDFYYFMWVMDNLITNLQKKKTQSQKKKATPLQEKTTLLEIRKTVKKTVYPQFFKSL